MESKGLRVNIGKTKIKKSGTNEGPVFVSGKYSCGVCNKGVGRNSIYCSFYNHWVHKRCSGLKGGLTITPSFKCHSCLHLPENRNEAHKIKLGNVGYKSEQFPWRYA